MNLRLVKVDKGLLQDLSIFDDHFKLIKVFCKT